MGRWWDNSRFSVILRVFLIGSAVVAGMGNSVWAQEAKTAQSAPAADQEKSALDQLDDDFQDYLHFALIGSFEVADSHAQALLQNPEISPELTEAGADRMVILSEKHENSIEILNIIIANTPISENAQKVLGLIRLAHKYARMKPTRIKDNIKLLRGTPMQRAVGMERLMESGEYAVPWMLDVLMDTEQQDMHPFVSQALPGLGKRAINPLIEALNIDNEAVKHLVAQALGKIGYPQALPYLKRIATDPEENQMMRESAQQAIEQIVVRDPGAKDKPAVELFNDLAEQYYADVDSLRPDPREDRANVWFLRDGTLEPVEVPRDIYMLVMSMRCCEASLELDQAQPEVLALWLASNFRRESRLGLDVQSEQPLEPGQSLDATRPLNYPRSIYFARIASPQICQIVLSRAMMNRVRESRDIALGAVAALNVTAGPAMMVNSSSSQGRSLSEALRFPDFLVRVKAALALGRVMPEETFNGSDEVVPTLASALYPADRKFFMVIDPSETSRTVIENGLTQTGATVIPGERLVQTLQLAHKEVTHLDGIFLASDMDRPTVIEALRVLAQDNRFALAPVVVFVKTGDTLIVDKIVKEDRRVGRVLVVTENDKPDPELANLLLAKRDEVAENFGYHEITDELRLELAMNAADTLAAIAAKGIPIYDVSVAQPALVEVLQHPNEGLRIKALRVLSLLDTEQAQRAIAGVALSPDQTDSLRMVAFALLADSARRFGSKLDGPMTQVLIEQATTTPDLVMRSAASKALGALSPVAPHTAEIILNARE